ncbi:hypothetical protein [Flavobacterium capsici]|uniref:Uncharacterized protein n=1 Tax=Flavobacterium capsici TaxID=3075618 RepID=A0AA96F4S0_9FLAO|nr:MULTISPECIES: hypothetical protein [unclassified Flavobacterium]WNM20116.1 hypothetical protein RN608_05410 [Flavobacterium sp. PMR2A8]WNM21506.1 hypothetical protein RN605_12580 [Flavobacterium sp. PMTSA4]
MNIYLDNNIVIDIEDGNYILEELLSKIGISQSKIFYSSVHITEADEMTAQDKAQKIEKRCRTISNLTSNNYIHLDAKTHAIHKQIVRPEEILKRHKYWTNNSTSGAFQKTELGTVSQEQRVAFRESLGLDPKEINNYTVKEVIEQFEINKDKFGNMSLPELIETATRIKLGRSATTLTKIVATFELLDMIGFWKDIYTTKSDFARAQDSQHCVSASVCDYFISNDKRTRNKSRLVYDIFKINTKVVDSNGFE